MFLEVCFYAGRLSYGLVGQLDMWEHHAGDKTISAKIAFEIVLVIIGYVCIFSTCNIADLSVMGHFIDMFVGFDASKQMLTYPTMLCK